jgi:phage shock protein PspC (stress-responsive transcriptional regulator)
VRIVWLVCTFAGLAGIIGYVVAWIVMPEEPKLMAPAAQLDKVAS